MMRWHRLVVLMTGLLLVWITITGAGIQIADMRALVSHAPETDPDMLLLRQHHNGPPNFFVVTAPDYTAAALPGGLEVPAALERAAKLGRAAEPGADLRLVELRMYAGKVAAHVQMNSHHLAFDLESGARLPESALPPGPLPGAFTSPRQEFKALHRFNFIGGAATVPDLVAGVAFFVLIVTGLLHFLRVFRQRRKIGKREWFWRGGGLWRELHRWVSIVSIVVILSLSVTGTLLSINSIGSAIYQHRHLHPGAINPFVGDYSSPLRDPELATMANATLAAFQQASPGTAVKVLRLRYFAGYAQGIVVAADRNTTQWVFNTASGARMGLAEKGYPDMGFPFGWEWNQRLKRIHRGDFLGMSGRWLVTVSALALVYLAISGLVLYYKAWIRRYRSGRPSLSWR
jgi:uncharacterized iron-regulated membrane protein